uniref:Alternative protein MOBKL2B n=1 Tax=Homo sapiens TaxID=9606 RepID=L0R5C0_HUMAN|nr:alternative protein MOBKL2B [Homo sapiens]
MPVTSLVKKSILLSQFFGHGNSIAFFGITNPLNPPQHLEFHSTRAEVFFLSFSISFLVSHF